MTEDQADSESNQSMTYFIYCLQNDIPFVADGNDGLQAELIAEAVHESLEKGVAVKIKRD